MLLVSSRLTATFIALAFVSGAFISSPELRASAAAAITSADIVDGTIRSVDIGSGEVKTSDIGNGHVTSAKIKDGNVMTTDLANNAVTSGKLADGAVTLEKLGTGVADGLKGTDGANGTDGINCWDLNGNRVNDESEDVNNDNDWDALDCQGSSSGFAPNTAPLVDAGSDQTKVGDLAIGTVNTLSCVFDLTGSVQDDDFTGYLAHEWTPQNPPSIQFVAQDELNTQVLVSFANVGPINFDPIFPITLTADDGILKVSDEIELTCEAP